MLNIHTDVKYICRKYLSIFHVCYNFRMLCFGKKSAVVSAHDSKIIFIKEVNYRNEVFVYECRYESILVVDSCTF